MTNIIGKLVAGNKGQYILRENFSEPGIVPNQADNVRAYQGLENHISKLVNTARL
jgi:hypothetical protein